MAVDALSQTFVNAGGKPDRINDARVIQFIGDDGISRSAQRGEQRFGCRPTRHKGVTGLKPKKRSDALLEFMMGGERSTNETDRCRASTMSIKR